MIKKLTFAAVLIAAMATNTSAQEMKFPDTIVVVDSSNSMWGQIDGVSKMSIARGVLGNLVDDLHTESNFGLMAFGHRRKTDCSDIQLVLPVGPLNSDSFTAAVNGLTPHGGTPLTSAIKEAAQILNSDTRSARVVIVSDGVESCEQNLCELTEQLEANGLDFTIHVVGFNVSTDAQDQLRCAADNTGGLFFTAETTGELKEALTSMMADEPVSAWVGVSQEVEPNSAIFVNWSGPNASGDYIALALVGQPAGSFISKLDAVEGGSQTLTSPAESGVYEVRYISGDGTEILAADTIIVR